MRHPRVRFSQRYRAFVIVDDLGMQAFDRDNRPYVFNTERHASEFLSTKGVDTLATNA